jgi:hypothetical protein
MGKTTRTMELILPVSLHKDDHRKTSDILREIAHGSTATLTIGSLSEKLGDRGFGLILLIFAIPNAIPLIIPGASTITGLPLIFLAAQLCFGRQKIWLPHFIAKREIKMVMLKKFVDIALPCLVRLEKVSKPRIDILTTPKFERIAGIIIVVLAFLIALPIPFGNFPLGVAITILALAITEQDGVLMIIGWISTMLALCFLFALVNGYAWLVWQMISNIIQT